MGSAMVRDWRELATRGREEINAERSFGSVNLSVRERREDAEDERRAWLRAAEVENEANVRFRRQNIGRMLAGTNDFAELVVREGQGFQVCRNEER